MHAIHGRGRAWGEAGKGLVVRRLGKWACMLVQLSVPARMPGLGLPDLPCTALTCQLMGGPLVVPALQAKSAALHVVTRKWEDRQLLAPYHDDVVGQAVFELV